MCFALVISHDDYVTKTSGTVTACVYCEDFLLYVCLCVQTVGYCIGTK